MVRLNIGYFGLKLPSSPSFAFPVASSYVGGSEKKKKIDGNFNEIGS